MLRPSSLIVSVDVTAAIGGVPAIAMDPGIQLIRHTTAIMGIPTITTDAGITPIRRTAAIGGVPATAPDLGIELIRLTEVVMLLIAHPAGHVVMLGRLGLYPLSTG